MTLEHPGSSGEHRRASQSSSFCFGRTVSGPLLHSSILFQMGMLLPSPEDDKYWFTDINSITILICQIYTTGEWDTFPDGSMDKVISRKKQVDDPRGHESPHCSDRMYSLLLLHLLSLRISQSSFVNDVSVGRNVWSMEILLHLECQPPRLLFSIVEFPLQVYTRIVPWTGNMILILVIILPGKWNWFLCDPCWLIHKKRMELSWICSSRLHGCRL